MNALPGLMPMTLVPNWVNSPSTNWRVPSPMEVNRMTEAIPMEMPTVVSAERRRCPRIVRPGHA